MVSMGRGRAEPPLTARAALGGCGNARRPRGRRLLTQATAEQAVRGLGFALNYYDFLPSSLPPSSGACWHAAPARHTSPAGPGVWTCLAECGLRLCRPAGLDAGGHGGTQTCRLPGLGEGASAVSTWANSLGDLPRRGRSRIGGRWELTPAQRDPVCFACAGHVHCNSWRRP